MKNEIYYDVLVVGSGAAGFAVANRIKQSGKKTVALITEAINAGTSRNTGSDKQTYYKLNLASEPADCVGLMAQNLFDGGCVDGDTAYCEAAASAGCFLHLASLGVPFPKDEYGTFVGYKTDHDPYMRASGAGPYTSKYMTEVLQKQAIALNVPIYDNLYVTKILTCANHVIGITAVNTKTGEFFAANCRNVVLATGGSACVFADKVYPDLQNGSTSLALTCGAALQNMTEWQFGLASVSPKWNVSGSYMQVLPRFVSVEENGTEHEFLLSYYPDVMSALSDTFLKGYQWPFDVKKAENGSSRIDLAVYNETEIKHRKVYLDYTENPFGLDKTDQSNLPQEAFAYLSKAGALQNTPLQRLKSLNYPAFDLYRQKGVDLSKEKLQIAVCAQHQNGGIAVDNHWQTDIVGLYAVGECAGTHGIVRPGGSALNAGQVGALRASEAISSSVNEFDVKTEFSACIEKEKAEYDTTLSVALHAKKELTKTRRQASMLMSRVFGAVRLTGEFEKSLQMLEYLWQTRDKNLGISHKQDIVEVYRCQDMLLTQCVVATAQKDYFRTIGVSRGSAVYVENAENVISQLKSANAFDTDRGNIRMISLENKVTPSFSVSVRPVRALPHVDTCFESVWKKYMQNTEND